MKTAIAGIACANLVSALDCVTDVVVALDREWRFTYLNRRAERHFRRPREELVGRVAREVLSEGIGVEAEERLRVAAAGGDPVEYDVLVPASGRRLTVRAFPSETDLVVYLQDVTERRAVEDALRESEARHRSFFEHSLDGMAITGPAGEILAVNDAACRILELDRGGDPRRGATGGR